MLRVVLYLYYPDHEILLFRSLPDNRVVLPASSTGILIFRPNKPNMEFEAVLDVILRK